MLTQPVELPAGKESLIVDLSKEFNTGNVMFEVLASGLRTLRKNARCANLQAMKATRAEPEIVTRNGKPVSVIVPIKDYEELLERVEDADDVAWLKRARKKPLHYRPLEDYLAERNRK